MTNDMERLKILMLNENVDIGVIKAIKDINIATSAPDFDSGWVSINKGEEKDVVHGLGGDPDNYVVDLMQKNDVLSDAYLHYHLNETSGTTAFDSTPNVRNGTLINMEDTDWVAAKLNNGLQFDGVDEYVDCGNICNFERTDTFSVEMWIKCGTQSQNIVLIGKEYYGGNWNGWALLITTGNVLRINLIGDSTIGNYIQVDGNTAVTNNTWNHVAFTYDGSSTANGVKIYVNAVLETKTVIKDALSISMQNAINTELGARNGTNSCYNGLMDEVVVYDRVLSEAEISYRYNSGNGRENTLAGLTMGRHSINKHDVNGCFYKNLDDNSITVVRSNNDAYTDYVKVRIWKHD